MLQVWHLFNIMYCLHNCAYSSRDYFIYSSANDYLIDPFMKTVNPLMPQLQMRFPVKDVPPAEIHVTAEIPPEYRMYLHPFCQAVMETSPFVDVLHQVVEVNGFTICNHVFIAKKDTLLEPFSPEPLATLHCMIKGSIKCAMDASGIFWLRSGQFSFFQVNSVPHKVWLTKDQVYESFHIDFSREQLERLSPYSEVVQVLLEKARLNQPAYLLPRAGIMHSRYYALITDIRNAHPAHKMWKIEVPANVALLLAIALKETDTPGLHEEDDQQLFATIRAHVLNNLQKDLGNAAIARNYCISISKLKQGFSKLYGESLQSFVRRTRLEAARELITGTQQSLQKIAGMVGYADYGNFSRRYRAHFGYPPSEEQRNV